MSHVVEPLFVEWQRFAPCRHSRVMLTHLRNNRVAWQRQQVPAVTSSPPSSSRDKSRRHSLPASRDVTCTSRDRRHSVPHAAVRLLMGGLIQLDALEECSPHSAHLDGHFEFNCEPQMDNTTVRSDQLVLGSPEYLQYLASLADRRRSLNTCSAHARRTVATSRRRSRSLVTPSCRLGNGVTPGHLLKPGVTSSSRDALPIVCKNNDSRVVVFSGTD